MLRLFGPPHIEVGDRTLSGFPEKGFLLLARLGLAPDRLARRASLAAWLWEDKPSSQANANLRRLLANIFRFEGENGIRLIEADRKHVWRIEGLPDDLDIFQQTTSLPKPDLLRRYIDRFGQTFLDGVGEGTGSEVENWLAGARREFHERFVNISREAAIQLKGADAEAALARISDIVPQDESVFRAYVLALYHMGSANRIKQRFECFRRHLRQEMGADPEVETIGLIAQLAPGALPEIRDKADARLKVGGHGRDLAHRPAAAEHKEQRSGSELPRLLILPPEDTPQAVHDTTRSAVRSLVADVTLELCRHHTFEVYAPYSARQFASGSLAGADGMSPPEYVVQTRLLPERSGIDRGARAAVSMVHAPSSRVLIAQELPVDHSHLPESRDNLSLEVARQIVSQVEKSAYSEFNRTGVATAYSLYLLGRERLEPFELKSIRSARKAFSKSLRRAPDFHPALHMYARTLNLEWFVLGREDRAPLNEAKAIAEQLTREHPMAPEGFWELGVSEIYLGDVDSAVEHFSAARQRAPHHADILIDLADALVHSGEHETARPHAHKALSLNPLAPDDYYWKAAGCEFMLKNYQTAIDLLQKLKYQDPAFRLMAASYALLGDTRTANDYRVRFMREYPDFRVNDWSKVRPFRRREDTAHFVEGLKLAGFQ